MNFREWCPHHFPGGSFSGDSYSCKNVFRGEKNASLSITEHNQKWFDHGTGEGGDVRFLCHEHGIEAWDGVEPWEESREVKDSPARAEAGKSDEAVRLWRIGKPATQDHPYLAAKKVDPFDLRIAPDGRLMVPGYDAVTGSFKMIQTIASAPDESGKWAKRDAGPVKGALWVVGNDKGAEDSSLVIAEGPSTAAAVKMLCPEMAVVCSFGTANLPAVYEALRKRFPDREIVIASDSGTEELAAKCRGALAVIPSAAKSNHDWNDTVLELGSEEARRQFMQKLESARAKAPKRINPLSLLCGPSPDKAVPPETVWLFPRGHLSVLASDPGAGKSMLMANVAADLSRGGRIIGGKEEPARRVLYLNGEAGKALLDARFRLGGWAFNPDNLKVVHLEEAQASEIALELDSEKGRQTIEALVESVRPDLLIVDSLIAFFGGDQNDAQAVRDVTVFLKRLAAKYDMGVCLVHHLRKRGIRDTGVDVTLNEIQGSNAILKLVNVVVGIETRKDDDDDTTIRIVRPLKSWSRPFPPFAFTFEDGDDDSFRLVFDHEPVLSGDHGKRGAWEALSRTFGHGEPFSRASVEEVCKISDGLARRYLRDWVSSGKLTREGNNRATEYRVVSSSRELPGTSPDILKKSTVKRESSVIPTIPDGTRGTGKVPPKYRQNEGASEKSVIPTIPDGTFGSTGSDCCSATVPALDGTFYGCTGKNSVPEEQPVEAPKTERVFPSRGASAPGPLVEIESFPNPLPLPFMWPGHGWIVKVNRTGNGERSFMIAKSPNGKPVCSLREPKRIAA